MTIISPAELTEIEQRANAATPGPWSAMFVFGSPDLPSCVKSDSGFEVCAVLPEYTKKNNPTPNFRFIAHSRTDIPALIASHRELQALIIEAKFFINHLAGSAPIRWLEKVKDIK